MPSEGTVVTARQTQQRNFQYHHNIEVNEDSLNDIDENLDQGDFVAVENVENDLSAECYGRIDICDEFDDSEAGIGYTLRYAIGTPEGKDVRIKPTQLSKRNLLQRFSDRIFGVRRVICRVRMAVEPDPGFRVCRISEETRELLGINEGDHVVLESSTNRVRDVKALPIEGTTEEVKKRQKNQNPERYPSCFDVIDIEEVRGTRVDIPSIYVDRDIREELEIRDDKGDNSDAINEGVCYPIVVYRDTSNLFGRIFLDIATPLIIAAAAAVIGLDTQSLSTALGLSLELVLMAKISILSLAVLVAIFTIWHRMRISLLD